ncbi:MAG: hypothetical protein WC781_03350 [Candidatus Pacearchaeota archaeon]|jgi:hypothetical protein
MECEFKQEDFKRLIYWITLKFKEDEFHHQAASTKSDLIGGFFDRWFNRASEFIIFRELLKNKDYDVVIDNFLYGQDTKKNAPDVIGLKDRKENTLVQFTLFNNGDWEVIPSMPFIEVKTNREKQKLISIGDTQMNKDHYYVIVESHIREDYLITLFEDSVFSQDTFNSLKVSKDFIKSDANNQIITPKPLQIKKNLGSFRLIGIFSGEEIKKYCLLVGVDGEGNTQKPYYFDTIEKTKPNSNDGEEIKEGCYSYGGEYIPFCIEFVDKKSKVSLVKRLKGHMVINVEGTIKINGIEASDGFYKVMFKKFDRSSKKKEYIGDKYLFDCIAVDKTNELISKFDDLVKKAKSKR